MNWTKLKHYKCPDCSATLSKDPYDMTHACTRCDFKVSVEKFDQIVGDMLKPKRFQDKDNLSDLNNFGHRKVTEDFSDSPFADN